MLALILAAAAFVGGCANDRMVIDQAQQTHQGLEPAVVPDPALSDYLQRVGDRIISTAAELDRQGVGPESHKKENSQWMFSNQMRFHFVNSQTLNAFTTGGEHMYIYTQLFQECSDEDELAAVMAHEYAHVYARHVESGMNRQMVLAGAAAGAGAAGYAAADKEHRQEYATYAAAAAMLGGQFLNMGFTRKDEGQADQLGFTFYTHAGWDPNQFGAFFQHMIDKGYDVNGPLGKWASDHPPLKDRVAQAKAWAAQLPPAAASWRRPPIASPEEFRQLQQRVVAVTKNMPDDKSLANAQQLLQALPRSCLTPLQMPDQDTARQELLQKADQALPPSQRPQQRSGG